VIATFRGILHKLRLFVQPIFGGVAGFVVWRDLLCCQGCDAGFGDAPAKTRAVAKLLSRVYRPGTNPCYLFSTFKIVTANKRSLNCDVAIGGIPLN
jgi:hypothetical protein